MGKSRLGYLAMFLVREDLLVKDLLLVGYVCAKGTVLSENVCH